MANISSSWILHNQDNVDRLRDRCLLLIKKRGTSQKELAYEAGRWAESEMSRWLNRRSDKLDPERYYPLLSYVAGTNEIPAENIDEIFAGIADFLGYGAEETRRQTANFVGDYVIHRYSMLAPGYILQGSLTIWQDEDLKAFRTKERYRIHSDILTRIKSQPEKSQLSEAMSKGRFLEFHRNGYFFSRSPDSYVMISRKSSKRAHEATELQTVYFDNVYESNNVPALLHGFLTDWHKKKFYCTRVVAQKLKRRLGDDLIHTLDPLDVNDVTNEYLTRMFDPRKFVISFT